MAFPTLNYANANHRPPLARSDVYEPNLGQYAPDIQSDFVPFRQTRIIVPLLDPKDFAPVSMLTPILMVAGQPRIMATHLLFSAQTRTRGQPVASASDHHDDIIHALDLLFTGF